MSDYMVGRKPGKDKYMVGWNKDKSNMYKVGGGGSSVGQADNKKMGSGDQDAVVGSKSAFDYSDDKDSTYKDVGDRGENSNMGGSLSMGAPSGKAGAAGNDELDYKDPENWSQQKNAMARRKGMMESAKYYSTSEFDSPTVDLVNIKKG